MADYQLISRMSPQLLALLKDLADVMEKHSAGIYCAYYDDGIYITQGPESNDQSKVCIGFPENGASDIRQIIELNS